MVKDKPSGMQRLKNVLYYRIALQLTGLSDTGTINSLGK